MGNSAAFFDIDGTIYREGLITEVCKKMIKYEIINRASWEEHIKPAYLKWDKRQGDYDSYLLKMVEVYTEAVKGIEKFQIEYIAKKVIEQKGDRVYTFSRDRILWHKKNEHKVIAISGSPIELVKEMSNKYEMDDYRGTIYKRNADGKFTGEVIPMWDAVSKRAAMLDMVDKYDIDLSQSFAYGDTAGDFTMLSMVGKPYAINPTRELLHQIRLDEDLKQKIIIVIERKDVIYKLHADQVDLVLCNPK
ncbi:MAG: haloacid dehalogenase [Epulopiscium sp. Nele67-Bin001]|nr:MAG: haloacid dehalogenase [Epulopiscium sp. Nele67-Bin001]